MNARFTTLPAITQTLATPSDKPRSIIPDLKDLVCAERLTDHGDPGDAPTVPPPLEEVANPARPSAAEEARTVAATTDVGTLASLTRDGDPWASFVTYGLLDGSPVLCASQMAEHGRNLAHDPRASIAIVAPNPPADPLASTRITLAGYVYRPEGDELAAAREAHQAAIPAAHIYIDFSDFSLWVLRVLRVQRIRRLRANGLRDRRVLRPRHRGSGHPVRRPGDRITVSAGGRQCHRQFAAAYRSTNDQHRSRRSR